MDLPLYLAMTAAEFQKAERIPPHVGWLACHFSSGSAGLSNLPEALPAGSLLILDDALPINRHDPKTIREELAFFLERAQISGVVLDFQRKWNEETAFVVKALASLPVPVGVTDTYCDDWKGAVFLSACPAYVPLREHLEKWKAWDIWLEIAMDSHVLTLTQDGCRIKDGVASVPAPWEDRRLHCHYDIMTAEENKTVFTLCRTREDTEALLIEAAGLGVKKAIGLYQELER